MRCLANVENLRFRSHAQPDSPQYRDKVAVPVMNAIDSLPLEYRRLIDDLGYVDIYRAWRAGASAQAIAAFAKANGGAFDYERWMARRFG